MQWMPLKTLPLLLISSNLDLIMSASLKTFNQWLHPSKLFEFPSTSSTGAKFLF